MDLLNNIQQIIRKIDDDIADQDHQMMILLREQKRIESQFEVFAANLETREPTGAKTFAYLKDQLTQKTIENMQLT